MASPDVGSKKRSVLRNLLSQPARSPSNQGELHASFLTQTCARCNGFARNRRAVTSYRARAITLRPETSLISTVLTGKERLGRKWMDEQRIDNCKVPIDKRGAKARRDHC